MKARLILLGALAIAGCVDASDPRWQLDHDRIVAVRATPPSIASGDRATFDALMAHAGAPTDVEPPTAVTAIAPPAGLADAVQPDGSVIAPDAEHLDQARQQLGLTPGTPVPFVITATFGPQPLIAQKTIYLGDVADSPNPVLGAVTVAGAAPADAITVASDVDVPLTVDADPKWQVYWLTSCGTMHDDNEHVAFVHVLPDDPMRGELAVVVRDLAGGVVWKTWPIQTQAP